MVFKINISNKQGKTFKIETESPTLIGKQLHDKIKGKDVSPDLDGYELEVTGASDKSGFTAMKEVEGVGLKKVLLSYEKGMKKRPRKEGKKKLSNKNPKGLRLRKTVRGKIISESISQINLKILKQGNKKLEEIFPEQNKKGEEAPIAPKGVPSIEGDMNIEGKKPAEKKEKKVKDTSQEKKQEVEEKKEIN